MNYDPTDEARGWHKYPAPTRRLRRFDHRNATRVRNGQTRAVTPVVSFTPVRIRHRMLRADITTYIDVAERVGLNPHSVAKLYRNRIDNGWSVQLANEVDIQFNTTFRGGDF